MWPHDRADRHPLDIALAGVNLSQLAIGVLGVLVITGEYSTGMIRASLTAVPKRLPVLWAKLGVFAVVTFVLMLPSVLIAFFASQAILSQPRHPPDLVLRPWRRASGRRWGRLPDAARIFALAIGAILRNTAGGIATFVAIFFVIPPLLDVLPTSWNNAISSTCRARRPSIFSLTTARTALAARGRAAAAGYCAVVVAIAAVLLVRRDV